MKIHLLDMGQTKYGDCIVITNAGRSILIDGGHQKDADSITYQLSKIFKKRPPFNFDLLVVTHCHSDHIGCLPELVALGTVTADRALVADEYMGFGLPGNSDGKKDALKLVSDAPDISKAMFVAVQEEDHSGLPDSELEQFLFDAAKLVDRYTGMLEKLGEDKTKIQRYPGDDWDWVQKFENEYFKDFGLKILGPTLDHLVICAEAIALAANSDGVKGVLADAENTYPSLVKTYRAAVKALTPLGSDDEPTADRPGVGAAKNNQSIVLSVAAGGWNALLAGDMQFGKAEVGGLAGIMNDLINEVNRDKQYDFIKLTHHTSYNGINERILNAWLNYTGNFAHTGGVKDPSHPEPSVLTMLKANSRNLKFARTDRNGMITVTKDSGEVVMEISKGRLNDFTENLPSDEFMVLPELQKPQPAIQQQPVQVVAPLLQAPVADNSSSVVKVTAEVPSNSTRVTVIVDLDPEKKNSNPVSQAPAPVTNNDASGRLSGLLFVTGIDTLAANIGRTNVESIKSFVSALPGSMLADIGRPVNADEAAAVTLAQLRTGRFKGVVILGGYDVVPSQRLMSIDDGLMNQLRAAGKDDYDADGFIVWSDDIYGDGDGDKLANFPVSRIPDGKDAALVFNCLQAPPFAGGARFGVRNYNRIFAEKCFDLIPGSEALEISEVFAPTSTVNPRNQCAVYYMLHGSEVDGTKFWGEKKGGRFYEALNINSLPHASPGNIIFSGACWGGLISETPAYRAGTGMQQAKTSQNSIAMAYLKKGVLGYVGCTGSHYSPVRAPWDTFGKPMHDNFWAEVSKNQSPAQALFEAKKAYITQMPHGLTGLLEKAVEVKIVRQFTCLGLGW